MEKIRLPASYSLHERLEYIAARDAEVACFVFPDENSPHLFAKEIRNLPEDVAGYNVYEPW